MKKNLDKRNSIGTKNGVVGTAAVVSCSVTNIKDFDNQIWIAERVVSCHFVTMMIDYMTNQ